MTRRELKQTNAGTSPECEFKIGNPVVILEINAGFDTHLFGNIKAALVRKRTAEDWDSYFASGTTIPSPGGDHASIFSWKGVKFWNGDAYTLKIVGKVWASVSMYADIVIDDEPEKYLVGAGNDPSVFAWAFRGGRIHDETVTGGANFSESDTEHKITVPSGERWELLYGYIQRDASATLLVYLVNTDDARIFRLSTESAATGDTYIPEAMSGATIPQTCAPMMMKAGDYLHFQFGASQSTAAKINCRFLKTKV